MAVKVGINGFGRIGRNFFRAKVREGRGHRCRRDQRPGGRRRRWRTCSSTTPSSAGSRAASKCGDGSIVAAGEEFKVLAERDPAEPPVGRPRRRRRARVDGLLHEARPGAQQHLDAGASKVVISAPATDPDVTIVLGVNDDAYDKASAQHHLERLVHDELRRADGEGAPRRIHDRARLHDDDPRVHERPEHPRPAARGPAACSSGRDQPDPDVDRRRARDRPRAARAAGEGRRHVAIRAPVPTGSIVDLVVASDEGGHRRRGQRGLPRGGRHRPR